MSNLPASREATLSRDYMLAMAGASEHRVVRRLSRIAQVGWARALPRWTRDGKRSGLVAN